MSTHESELRVIALQAAAQIHQGSNVDGDVVLADATQFETWLNRNYPTQGDFLASEEEEPCAYRVRDGHCGLRADHPHHVGHYMVPDV